MADMSGEDLRSQNMFSTFFQSCVFENVEASSQVKEKKKTNQINALTN